MNTARFIIGGVLPILASGVILVFRERVIRGIDRMNTELYGKLWRGMWGGEKPSSSTLILPAIGGIGIGVYNIVQSFH